MGKHIFEEGPRRGHAAGDTSIEQQASQLASDIKYKARQRMKGTSGSNLSPGQVQALYRSLLNSSSAPGGVKAIVKKKLFGEQVDCGEKLVSETLENTASKVFARVFVEGGGQKVEVEEIEEEANQKFIVRVTDRATGNTSYRKADRAKIAELRANKNISSVEITGRKKADDAYGEKHEKKYGPAKGKNTVGDKDGDGTKEPDRHEYAGVKDRAIKKAMAKEETLHEDEYRRMLAKERRAEKERESKRGGAKSIAPGKYADSTGKNYADSQMGFHKKVTGKTTTTEEVIYEKEENGDKKIDVMKGKNTVKINPTIGESIRAELDALKAVKIQEQEAAMKQQEDEKKKEALADQQAKKDKMMKLRILQNKMRAVRGGADITASYHPESDTIAEGEGQVRYCPKCDKDETRDECRYGGEYWDENSKPAKAEDPRGMKTNINLAKNKLRAMGLKMSYDMEGDQIDEGMNMKDFKKQRSRQKQKENRADEKTSPLRRAGIHADKASPERAARHRANVDPDFEGNDERNYPGGKLRPNKVRKAKALGELGESAEDRARDEHLMRGGMAARKDYDRPPAKKLSNAELGIKPGKTWVQKQMEKKQQEKK